MDKPIISVIIPVYNVEDYLEKAVNSICSQTLTDWEMFLIDDGSTDSSGLICDNLAADESRIHVIHQENQGAAAARNKGMESAQGKYLYFMDGDDWASPDMFYDMVCLAENYYLDAWAGVPVNNRGRDLKSIGRAIRLPSEFQADTPEEMCAQMVITGFYIETYYTETDYYIQKQSIPSVVYGAKSEFRNKAHQLFDRNLLYTVWNKLYLRSYIQEQDITFREMHWDDFPFNMDVIRNIERVTMSDNAYYHFIRKRKDSESEKYNPSLYQEREAEHKKLLGLYEGWRSEAEQELLEEMKNAPALISSDQALSQPETEELAGQVQKIQKEESEQETPDTPREEARETAGEEQKEEAVKEEPAPEPAPSEGSPFNFLDKLSPPVPIVNIPSPQASEFISRRYMERIVGCVENLTNANCTLSKREKRSEVKTMINSESVRKALKEARPSSLYMKALLVPIRMKSVSLTLLEGRIISKVKEKHVKTFSRLKANR